MIAASHSAPLVQPLLHDGPLTLRGHDKAVKVNLKTVADCVVVDARRQPAGAHQGFTIKTATLRNRSQFLRGVARKSSAAAADIDAEFPGSWPEPALQGAHNGGGDARRMPVHSHDRAERLEPERIAEARKEG